MIRIVRTAPFVVAIVLSGLSFFTPGSDLPQTDIWDKLGHALMFAALALTGLLVGIAAKRLAPALFGYAVLTEVLQAVLPIHRDGDWHDVLADSIGFVCAFVAAGLLARLIRPWAARTSSAPRHGPA